MAYWNIRFNPQIDESDPIIVAYLAKIETYCKILRDIPIGQGLRNEFIKVKGRPTEFTEGTLKEEIILRDIQGTAAIEGNTLNTQEINNIIINKKPKNIQEQEAYNLNQVRIYLEEEASKEFNGLLTETLIQTINQMIMRNIEEEGKTFSGVYRNYPVIVGKNHRPPDFEKVAGLMKEFITFINSEEILKLHPMIRAMLAHFYIVSIHPFGNGNGRTSRAVESFLFYCSNYSVHGFHSLNNYYYKNYLEYFNILHNSRFKYKGCLQEFIKFGLKGYLSELEDIKDKVIIFTQIQGYQQLIKELYENNDLTARQYGLIGYFIARKNSIKEIEVIEKIDPVMHMVYQKVKNKNTIQKDLNKLKELDLIQVTSKGDIKVNYKIMKRFTI